MHKTKNLLKILIVFFLLAFAIQAILVVYNLRVTEESKDKMIDIITSKDASTFSALLTNIESFLNMIETDSNFVYDSAFEINNNIIHDKKVYDALNDKFERLLLNSINNSALNSSFLFLSEDVPISYILPKEKSEHSDLNLHRNRMGIYSNLGVQQSAWYQETEESSTWNIWYSKNNNQQFLNIAMKLTFYNQKGVEIETDDLGVLFMSYDIDKLLSQLEINKFYKSALTVLKYNDEVVFCNNQYADDSFKKYEKSIYSVYPGLTLSTYVDSSDVMNSFNKVIAPIVLIIILLLGLWSWVLYLLNKTVMTPLKELAKHMLNTGQEKIACEQIVNEDVEILYQSYNKMCDNIKATEEENNRMKNIMLQRQINPHFMYNVLDSINAVLIMQDNYAIASIVSELADIMRYNLKLTETMITLDEEMTIISKFVNIQKFRLNDKLNVQYDICEEILNIKLPKFILQPLVENSIFHSNINLLSTDDIINVVISAKEENDNIILTIQDSNKVESSELNERLLKDFDTHSIGIKNVSDRLKTIYGQAYGLRYESTAEGLKAIVNIPKNL